MALFRCGAGTDGYKVVVVQPTSGSTGKFTIPMNGDTPSEMFVAATIGTGAGSQLSNLVVTNATLDTTESTANRAQWGTGWSSAYSLRLTNVTGDVLLDTSQSSTTDTCSTIVAYYK